MNTTKTTFPIAALFDFDGVVMDTETQYSVFWQQIGMHYLGRDDLHLRIKGQTLAFIYQNFFADRKHEQEEITRQLDCFEQQMDYSYVPGFLDFLADLKRHGVRSAIVTSSNAVKMAAVYAAHPELKELFDDILTAELFAASKPAPDCFLLGMKRFGTTPDTTFVFEDSFNGLQAGMASNARVVGLATTNPRDAIAGLCHCVIDDFCGFTYDKMLKIKR